MTRDRSSATTRLVRALLGAPEPLLDRIVGGPPIEVDGRVLDRRVQAMIVAGERLGLSRASDSVAERRVNMRRQTALGMPVRRGVHVAGRSIPGPAGTIPVRLYRAFGGPATPPAIVYYHGGGWVVGDLDTHDACCRVIADVSGCMVVAVDYRLAPEHPFPAAVEDAIAAYRWTQENTAELGIATGRVGVMGDSAGGNLAAVVAQEVRGLDVPPPVAQGLVYPATDARMVERSHELFAEGFFLTRDDMEWYRGHYLPDPSDWSDPVASPLLREDLSELPSAMVVTAGFDPLRDEGNLYAARLRDAGIDVRWRCYDDMVHGFFGMGILPDGMALITEVCATMGELMTD
jgi:acetyl esterase